MQVIASGVVIRFHYFRRSVPWRRRGFRRSPRGYTPVVFQSVCKLFIINDIESCWSALLEEVVQVFDNTRLNVGRDALYISLLVRLFWDRPDGAFNGEIIARKCPYVNDNIRVSVRTATSNGCSNGCRPRSTLPSVSSAPKRLMLSARYVAKRPQCVRRSLTGRSEWLNFKRRVKTDALAALTIPVSARVAVRFTGQFTLWGQGSNDA